MTKWEYKIERMDFFWAENRLESLGKEGWEMCGTMAVDTGWGHFEEKYVFKRVLESKTISMDNTG